MINFYCALTSMLASTCPISQLSQCFQRAVQVFLVPVFEETGINAGVDAGTPQVAQLRLLGGQANGVRPGTDGDDRVEQVIPQLH